MIKSSPLGDITFYLQNQETQRPFTVNSNYSKKQSLNEQISTARQRRCTPIVRSRYLRQKFSLGDNPNDNLYDNQNKNLKAEQIKNSFQQIMTERSRRPCQNKIIMQSCELQKNSLRNDLVQNNIYNIPTHSIERNPLYCKLRSKQRYANVNHQNKQINSLRKSSILKKRQSGESQKQFLVLNFCSEQKLRSDNSSKSSKPKPYQSNKQNEPNALSILQNQRQKCLRVMRKYSQRVDRQKKQIQLFLRCYA